MREDLVLLVLGTGERKYEDLFRALAAAYPGRVGVKITYDNALAHKVEAGADMFLMPSRYEPLGLNQMYSLKYGTVPIVRATGGLDDSIEPFDVEHGTRDRVQVQGVYRRGALVCDSAGAASLHG